MSGTSLDDPLARLARLIRDNDALMTRLADLKARTADARTYLGRPDCNTRFAAAHLERCRSKLLACLTLLRANRIEALQVLGEGGPGL